ncbi:MAG: ectoine hydroxylase-related dioxygenase (phytanoyl-CoA dioxygenase family) [Candidatus Latescibacterota bacterium]
MEQGQRKLVRNCREETEENQRRKSKTGENQGQKRRNLFSRQISVNKAPAIKTQKGISVSDTIKQHLYELDIYGFTVVENVLSTQEASAMREVLIRCEQEVGTEHKHRGTARHVSNLPTLDPVFFKTIDHPKTLPLLEHFLGEGLILGSLNSRIVQPGDGYQGLHSDIPAEMLNPNSPVMMNTVWMLDDFSLENGGTRVVPGSHKSGLAVPPEDMDVKHVVQPTAPAGSVIVFNGQTWHGGGANNSQADRHALFGHYRKRMLVFQIDPHDGFPPEWLDQLNDRQKKLMRLNRGLGAPHAADSHLH